MDLKLPDSNAIRDEAIKLRDRAQQLFKLADLADEMSDNGNHKASTNEQTVLELLRNQGPKRMAEIDKITQIGYSTLAGLLRRNKRNLFKKKGKLWSVK